MSGSRLLSWSKPNSTRQTLPTQYYSYYLRFFLLNFSKVFADVEGMKRKSKTKTRAKRKKHKLFNLNFKGHFKWKNPKFLTAVGAALVGFAAGFGHSRAKRKKRQEAMEKVLWALPVLLIFGIVALWNSGAVRYPLTTMSAKLSTMFAKAEKMDRGERIAFWSEAIYKNPALLSVLAPGPKISDTAPIFPNGYDCTTYVETVGALAKSNNGVDLVDHLISIRYKNGKIGYMTRNHFPEADWIPNNKRSGNLDDITHKVARRSGLTLKYARKEIDKYAWFKKQKNVAASRAIASMSEGETASVKIPYIELESLKSAVTHLPQGTVINVVRQSLERKPVLITHQGFLVWKKGVPYFRHASSFKEINEVPLVAYVDSLKSMPWRVLGLNFNQYE